MNAIEVFFDMLEPLAEIAINKNMALVLNAEGNVVVELGGRARDSVVDGLKSRQFVDRATRIIKNESYRIYKRRWPKPRMMEYE